MKAPTPAQADWLSHDHTATIIRSAEKRREMALQSLLGCTANSTDPMVREMWGRFQAADDSVRLLKKGGPEE